ncbi:CDP-diacylglycerol--serine O-phosphatidyltransferase [Jiulongibacter sp. NS-SX5]|uniref:CDP-diacylglycerol--serine O-phosphatidyltransferase n=1 Tax=Jiulongibacter sp. NS-SX5 TaxID=3463854 RepID=UPI004059B760
MKVFTLPNFITLGNLLCGILGILELNAGRAENAGYLIFIALILDFLDGFVARLTNSYSDIGKQLDSLADMVSFGVLPSLILYSLVDSEEWYRFITFMPALFSALRLAKFNIDERQGDTFYGVPTPANAMTIASLPFILHSLQTQLSSIILIWSILAYSVVISVLMIADIPLLALKFKDYTFKNNSLKYIFLMISLLLIAFLKLAAIPLILGVYLTVSFLNNLNRR